MLHQSKQVKRRNAATTPAQAGIRSTAVFTHSFASVGFTTATDLLEIGVIPANAQVLAVTSIGEGLGVATADVGVMDGKAGDPDETRTAGADFLDDANVNDAEASATALDCLAVAPNTADKGLGVHISADVAAGAGKKITVIMDYVY